MHVKVAGMGCGSCVAKITKAIQQLDGEAAVRVDCTQGKVEVESAESLEAVCQVITDLGFQVTSVPKAATGQPLFVGFPPPSSR